MTRRQRNGLAGVTLIVLLSTMTIAADAPQGAAKAAAASPELIGLLSKEIGGTPDQAAGAAGALFGLAKSRLQPNDFSQIANAVPGMAALLGAAPAGDSLSQITKSAGGLASVMSAFNRLGLKPEMVARAIPVLTSFVTKSGGANVGSLLAGVLK